MKKNELRKNNKGFSLVELIVVIAIMAVLVAIIAPQLLKYVEKGRQSTDIQTIDNVASALQNYYADVDDHGVVTVTINKNGNSGDAAITDAKLDDAKLKGTWSGDVSITLAADGQITVTGSSDYYTYDGTSNTPTKSTN